MTQLCCASENLLWSTALAPVNASREVLDLHDVYAVYSINQSMEFTVRVGEPDVAHWTSWLESTGECSGRPKAFGENCAPKRGECYLGEDQTMHHAAA